MSTLLLGEEDDDGVVPYQSAMVVSNESTIDAVHLETEERGF